MFEEEKNSQNQILHIFAYLPQTMKLLKFKCSWTTIYSKQSLLLL